MTVEDIHQRTKIDPWFLHAHPRPRRDRGRAARVSGRLNARRPSCMLRGEAARLLRPPARAPAGTADETRGPPAPQGTGHRGRLQVGRHLRRRVRGVHAVLLLDVRIAESAGRRVEARQTSDSASRLADVRSRRRSPPVDRQSPHHDPRRRAEPHRPGDRVRLLLLPGRLRPARRRLREPSWSTRTRRPSRPTTTLSDHLFFEPLTVEDVLNICDRMKPEGLIVQFGGQTPLNLAQAAGGGRRADHRHQRRDHRHRRGPRAVRRAGRPTRPEAAGQRHRRATLQQALHVARRIGFPVLVRPSFVLGGRAMEIVYDEDALDARYVEPGRRRVAGQADPDRQVPRDRPSRWTSIASATARGRSSAA